ncbi:MAG: NAD-dependent protein deacylase [Clostridiales bacterium]|nr:NAD-dependent protein deacylase [Clostridiales bacterium]
MDPQISEFRKILDESSNIVFFGGAGVSTESGIPDFRSSNGLYSMKLSRTVSPEEMVSHTFYMMHPEEFFEFYRGNLIYPDAKPNACHYALAELEKEGKLKAVITQNIDGLHQTAGSKMVHELHGSVLRNYCEKCNTFYGLSKIIESKDVPICDKCGGRIKPDVVLYEEALDPDVVSAAIRAIELADTLIIGGTTLIVYPAAGLIRYFRGKKLVLINKTKTSADGEADLVIRGSIGEVFEQTMSIK